MNAVMENPLVESMSQWDQDPETQLMLRFASGDEAAFDSLVEVCQGGLIQFFQVHARDRSLAEDLAQEVFIRIYQSGRNYRPKARFKTYLFRIARNLWIDHLRRERQAGRNVSLDVEGEDEQSLSLTLQAPDVEAAEATTGLVEIKAAINRLPDDQRQVFMMSQLEGMRYEEIADVLEVPVGTVKSRMFHGVRRLRRLLKDFQK